MTRTANPSGRLLPGLHKLDDERNWLVHDPATFAELMTIKQSHLREKRADTLVTAAGCEESSLPAQREVLDMVVEHLPRRYPDSYSFDKATQEIRVNVEHDNGSVTEAYDVATWRSRSPLELAGLLAQEDFVLVNSHRIEAGFVVFSFGRVAERIGSGMSLDEVHKNVQRFQPDLSKPVDRFFHKLTSAAPAWRSNFGLTWSGTLVSSPDRYPFRQAHAADATLTTPAEWMLNRIGEVGVGNAIWLKVEYQTIKRLAVNADYALFAVRTFVHPLHTLSSVPSAASTLAHNIRCAAEGDFKFYLGVEDAEVRGKLLEYLDGIAAAADRQRMNSL